ncbi:MAG: immunoglobulin domain-containing protein [Phycisphaerae bacterium]
MRRTETLFRFRDSRLARPLAVALLVWTVFGGTVTTGVNAADVPTDVPRRFDNPAYSPDGRWIALAGGPLNALYLYDTVAQAATEVAGTPGSGYACNWSADGTKLGFKLFVPAGGGSAPLQVPAFFHTGKRVVIALHAPVARCGVPSFAADGRIAFTLGEELWITDESGRPARTFGLDNYANLTPISPDGSRVAYNDRDEHICVLDLSTGARRLLTTDETACFNPVWAPDSSRLAVNTVSGRLRVIEVATGRTYDLGEGIMPSWAPDARTVFFSRIQRTDGVKVLRADVYQARFDGECLRSLTADTGLQATAGRVAFDGSRLAFVSLADGEVYQAPLYRQAAVPQTQGLPEGDAPAATAGYLLGTPVRIAFGAVSAEPAADEAPILETAAATTGAPITPAVETTLTRSMPYIHQAYDTPDDFNGNWACGATSAMMCIGYYNRLPYWDCTCSTPYSHISHYGRYISQIYTFNGYTYNIGSPDASGNTAYGGYGYIVRNNWADTKGYMRDYLNNHAISSSVDWSPTFAKLQAEVNNQYPFVLLNSLTTAGHYIATIGYVDGQYTAIFNDPWGNKNISYPGYNGAGARYDWPGYNNGYQNLNTVHCFIYARSGFPPTITQHPVPQTACAGGTAAFTVAANGSGTLAYQWQKNGVGLSNGGHYAGVTTATLTVSNADGSDAANYRCLVTNAYGSAVSNEAALAIRPATSIAQHPADQGVCPGATATFAVSATGDGTLAYQWQKSGSNLANGGHYSGVTTPVLTVSDCDGSVVADYRCVVTGGCGSATSNAAALTLRAVTVITQQPVSQHVCAPATATFTVATVGDGALQYRWQKDGANLSDSGHYSGTATATLTISNVDRSCAASYTCVVTGGCQSAVSAPASLSVGADTPADFDADCDVDLGDFVLIQMCFSGANRPVAYPECIAVDMDGDADVDLLDFATFQACFNSPNRLPKCP